MIDLDKLEALMREANPLPYLVEKGKTLSGDNWMIASFGAEPEKSLNVYLTTDAVRASQCRGYADTDAEFIAAGMNALPELIAEIRELRKEKDE